MPMVFESKMLVLVLTALVLGPGILMAQVLVLEAVEINGGDKHMEIAEVDLMNRI